MKHTKVIMGMPITVEVIDAHVTERDLEKVFQYFEHIDKVFSTYKNDSEISAINRREIALEHASEEMKEVFRLSEETKHETEGYFDITRGDGTYDPSGLVKGWSIRNAAALLKQNSFHNFYVEAGGDIEASGYNSANETWSVGIKNPWNEKEIVKVVYISEKGMATSGSYIRGDHIYNPHNRTEKIQDIVSITVIGPTVYDADRFATAAFAMGRKGIHFIEKLSGFEAYMIDADKVATETSGFRDYTHA